MLDASAATRVGDEGSPVHGLTEEQAAIQLAADGPNELPRPRPLGWRTAISHQLRDVVILVLVVAAGLTAAVGDVTDLSIIAAVIVVNTALGAVQELRSARALDALAELTAPHAVVVRAGHPRRVPAREVVVGDHLQLSAGDVVAADAKLDAAWSLQLDESMLTGESLPVGRIEGDRIEAGTVVVRGRAEASVTATGRRTALGRIAGAVEHAPLTLTPLQRQLAGLGRWLAVAVSLAATVLAVINLATGHSIEVSLVLAISLAVAAIPESLPAVVALSLALAARRMAQRGVLVRRLSAVEALGSITVLALDKTGTLTTGRMRVSATWTPAGASTDALWTALVLCNDAEPGAGPDALRRDPIEAALLTAAEVDPAAVRARYPRIGEEPFDPLTASMTTTHYDVDGTMFRIRKGAPERLFEHQVDGEAALAQVQAWSEQGMRALGVLREDGSGWHIVGAVAFADPPRDEAPALIAAFRTAGVRPVMLTGDHAVTAQAVARAIGLTDQIDHDCVRARVRPDGKTEVVRSLQRDGAVVAMTGDGVNDAPALRTADIGVAMGRRGTEVAKQSADLVLTSDDLSALVPAIAEGRRAYDNVRRFLHYALSGGVAEVLIMLVGPALGLPIPLQAGQILWVNLLTHGLPGVAMGSAAAEPDVLSRAPRDPAARLIDRALQVRVLGLAIVISLVSLAMAGLAKLADQPWQTAVFLTLTLAQLGIALALHPRGRSPGRALGLAVAANVVLAALAVWWSPLARLLRLESLPIPFALVCLLAALIPASVAARQRR